MISSHHYKLHLTKDSDVFVTIQSTKNKKGARMWLIWCVFQIWISALPVLNKLLLAVVVILNELMITCISCIVE